MKHHGAKCSAQKCEVYACRLTIEFTKKLKLVVVVVVVVVVAAAVVVVVVVRHSQ